MIATPDLAALDKRRNRNERFLLLREQGRVAPAASRKINLQKIAATTFAMNIQRPTRAAAMACVLLLLNACAAVEFSGRVTRSVGDAMTGYAKENDGFLAGAIGWGGGVYTSVGGAMETAAKGSKDEPSKPEPTTTPAPPQKQLASVETTRTEAPVSSPMTTAQLQTRLSELGYQPGPANGTMSKRTVDALSKFQKKSGLPVTGKADLATVDALRIAKRSE